MGRRLLLSAKDVMLSGDDLPIVSYKDLSKDVIKTISEKGMGISFVLSEKQKIIGLITDGDLEEQLIKPITFLI